MGDPSVEAESIFAKARTLPLDRREAYLAETCGDDLKLRALVESLLRADEDTGVIDQDRPAGQDATLSYDVEPTPFMEVGSTIGPYKLLEKIGEGGFGVIYIAEQHEPVRRRVALKIIKLGMDTKQVIARFEAERQALALMDHPNIAKVFDAGATETGRPYFVMELVKGMPITQYCDQHQLDTRQRLELLITVCNAIQHAHEKGIIHRDIKPTNVLVSTRDDAPVAKVIDFGIAKATHQSLTDKTIFTAAHQVIGTPRYMSPEQAGTTGTEIDKRTDVYSLGVLLCELLTGTTPFATDTEDKRGADDIYRMIREREPTRPSTNLSTLGDTVAGVAKMRRTDPISLRRLLKGDLDWIILKCLDKDRTRRYRTAAELADDIKKHLASQPISASPPSTIYRLRKLARRRRTPLVGISLLLIILAISLFSGLTYLQSVRRHAREVQRLADIRLLAELRQSQAGLPHVAYEQRRAALDKWLEQAGGLVSHLPDHQRDLQELATKTGPAATAPADDGLAQLIDGIQSLAAPGGHIEIVEQWASLSPSPAEFTAAWKTFATAVEPPTAQLPPQEALFPLGPNPQSGCWEFVDLNFGLAPRRGTNDQIDITAETGIIFVWLPGGRFVMGSPDDEPGRKADEHPHTVVISPFLISKYEVTQPQWQKVMGQNPSRTVGINHPVDTISWHDCQRFAEKTGLALPTEAQSQYACRAGTTTAYSSSAPLDQIAWYAENSGNTTHPVGEKLPNNFGLYDTSGNVLEWCQDVYADDFFLSPEAVEVDPVNSNSESENADRVLLGGSYEAKPAYLRSADRYHEKPDLRWRGFGLRPTRPIQ